MALKTARRYVEQQLEVQADNTKVAVICVDTPLDCSSPMINRILSTTHSSHSRQIAEATRPHPGLIGPTQGVLV